MIIYSEEATLPYVDVVLLLGVNGMCAQLFPPRLRNSGEQIKSPHSTIHSQSIRNPKFYQKTHFTIFISLPYNQTIPRW